MNALKKSPCMLCGNVDWAFHHELRDDIERWVGRCGNCGHVQITRLPSREEESEYYQKNDQIRTVVPESVLDDELLVNKYRPFAEWQVERAARKISVGESILEIGSGFGWFVELMRGKGYEIEGIEISAQRRELVGKRCGISLHDINLLDGDQRTDADLLNRFDVIWMYHVLEHIVDPVSFLSRSARYLKKGGRFIIAVPNLHDFAKNIVKEYGDFCYLRAHVSYFSAETLTKVMERCSIRDIHVSGDQPYCVENIFHWISMRKPCVEKYQLASPTGLEFLDRMYRRYLEERLLSWSIVATGGVD